MTLLRAKLVKINGGDERFFWPAALDAVSIRDEKVKVYKSIRPLRQDTVPKVTVRGQYSAGEAAKEKTPGNASYVVLNKAGAPTSTDSGRLPSSAVRVMKGSQRANGIATTSA